MNGYGSGIREPYLTVHRWLQAQHIDDLKRKSCEAEALFRRTGITFAVYGDTATTERLIPFDIIPRILSAAEWRRLAAGIEQRVRALNAFIYDIYHRQEIIRAGRIPEDLIVQNAAFLPEMMGVEPARGVYAHVIGIDIVRTSESEFFVLEDNTRTPSGVSYMLENREAMMHMFPELFARNRVAAVEDYPDNLRLTLESVAPPNLDGEPTVAVLTPGIHNSAYFEHSFLADQMGVELVEGQDLLVSDGVLRMKTTQGLKQVDVVYRRIDDSYLDPLTFRSDSAIGVPGIDGVVAVPGATDRLAALSSTVGRAVIISLTGSVLAGPAVIGQPPFAGGSLLQKLLKGELATRRRKNVVQARSFSEMLEQTIRRYQNRAIEAAQVIEELIALAKDMREANARGEGLGLSEDELAFYDALETNDSAVKVLGDETLRAIARELVETVRDNVTIDWTLRENVRAQLRVLVKRILRKHGYPPDKQEKATQTVLEQAELLSAGWST